MQISQSLLKTFSFPQTYKWLASHIDHLWDLLSVKTNPRRHPRPEAAAGSCVLTVLTYLIPIWVKINVWQRAKSWTRSINMDSPPEWNQHGQVWSSLRFKGNIPERQRHTPATRLARQRATIPALDNGRGRSCVGGWTKGSSKLILSNSETVQVTFKEQELLIVASLKLCLTTLRTGKLKEVEKEKWKLNSRSVQKWQNAGSLFYLSPTIVCTYLNTPLLMLKHFLSFPWWSLRMMKNFNCRHILASCQTRRTLIFDWLFLRKPPDLTLNWFKLRKVVEIKAFFKKSVEVATKPTSTDWWTKSINIVSVWRCVHFSFKVR